MIGIPFFMDQYQNLRKVRAFGYAEQLDVHSLTVNDFVDGVRSILTNAR